MRSRSHLLLAMLMLWPVAVGEAQGGGEGAPPGVVVARATEVPFPLEVEALGTARANDRKSLTEAAIEKATFASVHATRIVKYLLGAF